MSEPSNYTEARRDVMAVADELTTRRKELLDTFERLNAAVTQLHIAADRLFQGQLAEAGPEGKVRNLTYRTSAPSPQDIAEYTQPSQRKCSNCGEPGHRATTCTSERKEKGETIQDILGDTPGPVKGKKKRKPVSLERKEQLTKQLAEARKKRGKK